MTRKKRAWLSTLLFLAIFAGLLITATFTDFQVSQFLTSKALAAHTYLTNASVFGVAFEALGSDPVYLAFAFAFQILFWYCLRKKDLSAAPKTLLSGIMAVCSFVANYVLVNDTMGYIEEHITGDCDADLPRRIHSGTACDQKAGRPHPLPRHECGRSRSAAGEGLRLLPLCEMV